MSHYVSGKSPVSIPFEFALTHSTMEYLPHPISSFNFYLYFIHHMEKKKYCAYSIVQIYFAEIAGDFTRWLRYHIQLDRLNSRIFFCETSSDRDVKVLIYIFYVETDGHARCISSPSLPENIYYSLTEWILFSTVQTCTRTVYSVRVDLCVTFWWNIFVQGSTTSTGTCTSTPGTDIQCSRHKIFNH